MLIHFIVVENWICNTLLDMILQYVWEQILSVSILVKLSILCNAMMQQNANVIYCDVLNVVIIQIMLEI